MTFRGDHVDELISASLTGELTDADRAELEAHLARCEACRDTLAAFTAERRILSGLPVADAPRDLSARVRSGIEGGRFGRAWWRRPGGLIAIGASVATVAAAVLAVVVVNKLDLFPVGRQTSSPGPSALQSVAPSGSPAESVAPSLAPTPVPDLTLGQGELGYLSVTGAPLQALKLSFINDATGDSIDAGSVSGPTIAASLSPDGRWLAYISQKGETGANEVWVLSLADGNVTHLGCSSASSFANRLIWSPDGRYLAFTLVGIDLGTSAGCQPPRDGADAWVFDTTLGKQWPMTRSGNGYAASFGLTSPTGDAQLWVSFAAAQPESTLLAVNEGGLGRETGERAPGVFLPLLSPDGNRALFWSGTMTSNGGSWHFSLGGMPQLSGDFRSAGPASPWIGTPLFTDLVPVGGEAFASGDFAWAPDGNTLAFWNGAWTGAPQSNDGSYPSDRDVYLGSVTSGLLSAASRVVLGIASASWIVDVAFGPGGEVAVTEGIPSAGIGDPPSAVVEVVSPCCGGKAHRIGGGVDPPPWDGPGVYGR
jgi:predicted anti-sigma-YlaC factor YlaD